MATQAGPRARILIVAPSWVGDLVMAQPLFAALAAQSGVTRIDAVAPPATFPLLERIPEVHRSWLLAVGHGELGLGKRWRLARELREERFDQAIILPNSFKSALLPLFAGIERRTGWQGEMRYGLLNDRRRLDSERLPLMVDRYRALATPDFTVPPGEPRPRLRVDGEALPRVLEALGLHQDRPVLVLCPGAEFGPAKRWPADRFAAVADHFIRGGWQVWALGSKADQPITRAVQSALSQEARNQFSDLAGRTTLPEAVDLISLAKGVLANDSGLMHIAAAVGRPVWVIYGSSSPGFTPPLADSAQILSLGLACSPCFERECPLGHLNCLRQLSAEAVLESMTPLLHGKRDQEGRGEDMAP